MAHFALSISTTGATNKIASTGSRSHLAPYGASLYWPEGHAINAVATTGGATTSYATANDEPVAIAVDATSLYYLTRSGDLVQLTPK